MVKIPFNLEAILLGVLLSDGWLFINKAGNILLAFKQTINKLEYFFYVFLINYLIIVVQTLDWRVLILMVKFLMGLFSLLDLILVLRSGIIFFMLIKKRYYL